MPGSFTKSQFKRWDAALGKTSPGAATTEELATATLVTGAAVQGMSDGIVLRFTDETGRTHNFHLNAAMAMRVRDTIPAVAQMAGWLAEDGVVEALNDPKP